MSAIKEDERRSRNDQKTYNLKFNRNHKLGKARPYKMAAEKTTKRKQLNINNRNCRLQKNKIEITAGQPIYIIN